MPGQHQSGTPEPALSGYVAGTMACLLSMLTLLALIFRTDFWMLSDAYLVVTLLYVGGGDPDF